MGIAMALGLAAAVTPGVHAAEGMWTLDSLPLQALEADHGFVPDARWRERAMGAPVRLAGGCSGSFVSRDGLVLTNHHCIRDCVQQFSTADRDYVAGGFLARSRAEERRCPEIELNRLNRITDVTADIRAATLGATGEAFTQALNGAIARITAACTGGNRATVRCDVVTLYGGGRYHLYRYDRFQDARLVFVPEEAIAFFGGDPDNFNFPRYNLDVGLLRAYRDGRPVRVRDYFPVNPAGAREGELVMTLGHPGATDRQLTVAQLLRRRDMDVIPALLRRAEIRGVLTEFGRTDRERARIAGNDLKYIENALKADRGYLQALLDPELLARKAAEEEALRAFIAADPGHQARAGDALDRIARAQEAYRRIGPRWKQLERGGAFFTPYFNYARLLVRGAEERRRPDGERLPEFAEAALPGLEQFLGAPTPLHPELEQVKLAWSLGQLREQLSADDPTVRLILGPESPAQVAARLVGGTTLGDPAVRRDLWQGGADAVAASRDPFILLARAVDAESRELRRRYEAEVETPERQGADRITAIRFVRSGTGTYPDATFTLRLSHGVVRGWQEGERRIAPFTDFAGAFRRHTGAEPFALPPSWLERRDRLDGGTPLNFVSTNDITGGNSGSPVINRAGEVVGLIFDGNLQSLGGDLWYDEGVNRAVSVHSAAILLALREIYGAVPLADEMTGGP